MTDAPLEYQPPGASSHYVVILLHGLGASGEDLFPLAPELADGRLKVICPHAPARAVTVNGGMVMPAWYDIVGVNLEDRQDAGGVAEATRIVESLIAQQKAAGFTSRQILLAGFSQGAAVALHAGLRHVEPLAGIVALSGYLLFAEQTDGWHTANRATPIFQAHGTHDPVVLVQWARHSRDALRAHGYALSYHEYPAVHTIPPQAVADCNAWLHEQMAEPPEPTQPTEPKGEL